VISPSVCSAQARSNFGPPAVGLRQVRPSPILGRLSSPRLFGDRPLGFHPHMLSPGAEVLMPQVRKALMGPGDQAVSGGWASEPGAVVTGERSFDRIEGVDSASKRGSPVIFARLWIG
jgi:hypothetical protein